jgi:hypothetical protein
VWSPTGGYHCDPHYWRRNTAIAFVAVGIMSAYIFDVSRKLEVRATNRTAAKTLRLT